MESKTPSYKKLALNWLIVGIVLIVIVIGSFLYLSLEKTKNTESSLQNTQLSLQQESKIKTTCIFVRDSINKELAKLSVYKSLTMAMIVRDEATLSLKYKVGDIAYKKNDSAKVVIQDIIIGGSKYNYYVKYSILYTNDSSDIINPLILY